MRLSFVWCRYIASLGIIGCFPQLARVLRFGMSNIENTAEKPPSLGVGSLVRVLAGAYIGRCGEVVAVEGRQLLLKLGWEGRAAVVPLDQVRPTGQRKWA